MALLSSNLQSIVIIYAKLKFTDFFSGQVSLYNIIVPVRHTLQKKSSNQQGVFQSEIFTVFHHQTIAFGL